MNTEMENGRNKVFKFQMSKLDTKIINEKLLNNQREIRSQWSATLVLSPITGECLGGSLTGIHGSENLSTSSMVIGVSTDPSSQEKRKSSNG